MTMFKYFPTINYNEDGFSSDLVNILTAALPRRLNVDRTYVFQTYRLTAGQTPESLASELYKEPNYHWTILIINDIVNPYLDWPMNDEELEEYCTIKYTDIEGIHHFNYLDTGKIVDDFHDAIFRQTIIDGQTLPFNVTPVTNFAYENILNDSKREILVVNPQYISQFVDSFNKAIQGKNP